MDSRKKNIANSPGDETAPRSALKRSSTTKKTQRTGIPGIRNRVGFDQGNVKVTSHIPTSQRTYGLIKAVKTLTPFPKMSSPLDQRLLLLRLEAEKQQTDAGGERVVKEIITPSESPTPESELSLIGQQQLATDRSSITLMNRSATLDQSFESRRKRFYEAEFTIAKGKKMSEFMHPQLPAERWLSLKESRNVINTGFSMHGRDSQYSTTLGELEKMCRKLNIKITRGFEL
ncbi:uncharacterized protein LOC115624076 [Scaptodrosophila lebanonensis]|uniref:Uncharacterized protein LOC115624076 n=1 Tax=Drosophila lebanonensis TaxID=7225 RepID=A0A6J2TCL0_DROLE|nr:uncharacterized protein LOC115624076 [Scaptodrosophila lebanonensis]